MFHTLINAFPQTGELEKKTNVSDQTGVLSLNPELRPAGSLWGLGRMPRSEKERLLGVFY